MRRKILILTVALAATGMAHTARAADTGSVRFHRLDWELVCDNTRTCRAAGYHADEAGNAPVSVLLERKAGPGHAITARLRLGDYDESSPKTPSSVTTFIDGKALGRVALGRAEPVGNLSQAQTDALLRAVAGSGTVEWQAGGRSWGLSGAGAAAVLLKMDEVQGRLGTRGAAIRKGATGDEAALPARPAPAVRAAAVPKGELPPLASDQERVLLASLRRTIQADDCELLSEVAAGKNQLTYSPLTADRMLVSTLCWRGPYNEAEGYWVVNRKPPYAPRFVMASGTGYGDGSITGSQRGRGLGDCYSREEWVWDGQRFVQTLDATTGMCRGIAAGGAWDLPTLVSDVRREGHR